MVLKIKVKVKVYSAISMLIDVKTIYSNGMYNPEFLVAITKDRKKDILV